MNNKKQNNLKWLRSIKGLSNQIYNHQIQSSKERNHPLPSYTKEEFREWLFSQKEFDQLYEKWVERGYDTKLKPSVDRENPLLYYTFDNISLMTWEDNYKKAQNNKKIGINTNQLKPVIQLTKEGLFVNEFISIKEASRETKIDDGNITKCCKNIKHYNSAGGFKWVYKEDYYA